MSVPTPSQRTKAMQVAGEILVEAIRSGKTRTADWVGSEAHILRTALIDASYRDSFPNAYPASEVEAARALIIEIGGAQ